MTGSSLTEALPADRVRVAVLQTAAEPGEVAVNVERLVALIEEHGPGVDLVVAPELATTGYDLDLLTARGRELAEPADGATARRLAELATRVGATLVVGFIEQDGDDLYDSLLMVSPSGPLGVYRKSHLYPPELAVFSAGRPWTSYRRRWEWSVRWCASSTRSPTWRRHWSWRAPRSW